MEHHFTLELLFTFRGAESVGSVRQFLSGGKLKLTGKN